MIFDDDISESVSLSRVLDCFVEEQEKPSVILNFLENYNDDIEDILSCSRLWHRIFSLDFVKKCSHNEVMSIYRIVKDKIDNEDISMYLCWQILRSDISNSTKDIFRSFYYLHKKDIQHPYKGCIGKEASIYDTIWCDSNRSIEEIVDIYNSISISKFERIVKTMDNSLWKYRFLQCDVFDNLTNDRQWIVVNGLHQIMKNGTNIDFFFRQVLVSNNLNNLVKSKVLLCMRDYSTIDYGYRYYHHKKNTQDSHLPKELEYMIRDMSSAAQFSIKLRLLGMELYLEHAIIFLIKNNMTDILFGLGEYMEDELRDNFDIVELIEFMTKDYDVRH